VIDAYLRELEGALRRLAPRGADSRRGGGPPSRVCWLYVVNVVQVAAALVAPRSSCERRDFRAHSAG
jgi:hypothetical protein